MNRIELLYHVTWSMRIWDCKRHEIEKTRVTRVTRARSYEELRGTGEQKREPSERQNNANLDILRFEDAFELNNLDLLLIICCCNSLCFDIYIYL